MFDIDGVVRSPLRLSKMMGAVPWAGFCFGFSVETPEHTDTVSRRWLSKPSGSPWRFRVF
jgi:hypothetical protein